MSTHTKTAFLGLLALSALAVGCSDSHGRGRDSGSGERCGPSTCEAGEVCCNESCGICVLPGEGCPAIACIDAGGPLCGDSACEAGELCCPACPGNPDFCVSGSSCPDLACPPPPPGCESCGAGELCCPGCPGSGSFCAAGPVCPAIDCPPPPPGCESCGAGELCCPGCPGTGSFCVSGSECPVFDCPMPVCEGRSYCECVDAPGCEPLVDLTPGCICPCDDPFNCTGELCACACGGAEYRGCTDAGRCPETQVHCDPACNAVRGPDGCLTCVCADAGG